MWIISILLLTQEYPPTSTDMIQLEEDLLTLYNTKCMREQGDQMALVLIFLIPYKNLSPQEINKRSFNPIQPEVFFNMET